MAANLRNPLRQSPGNGRPRETVVSAASIRLATATERERSIDRRYALIASVLIVAMSGCRALSLIPHNHTCPYANPLFHLSPAPFAARAAAGRQQAPYPPQMPPPMTPYGAPQSSAHSAPHAPPPHAPPQHAPPQHAPPQHALSNTPSQPPTQSLAPQSLPPVTPPMFTQSRPPVPVEDVVIEQPPTVVETLLTLRQEMEDLRNNNADLTTKLETFQQDAAQRAIMNQTTNTLMQDVRDDLTTVQNELDAWRTDLSALRGRVRDQHVHHERTLVDVEKQLHDMISVYGDADSESGR